MKVTKLAIKKKELPVVKTDPACLALTLNEKTYFTENENLKFLVPFARSFPVGIKRVQITGEVELLSLKKLVDELTNIAYKAPEVTSITLEEIKITAMADLKETPYTPPKPAKKIESREIRRKIDEMLSKGKLVEMSALEEIYPEVSPSSLKYHMRVVMKEYAERGILVSNIRRGVYAKI